VRCPGGSLPSRTSVAIAHDRTTRPALAVRVRANYQESDSFLSGLATPDEAADFHAVFLRQSWRHPAHRRDLRRPPGGHARLLRVAEAVPIPPSLGVRSVLTRRISDSAASGNQRSGPGVPLQAVGATRDRTLACPTPCAARSGRSAPVGADRTRGPPPQSARQLRSGSGGCG